MRAIRPFISWPPMEVGLAQGPVNHDHKEPLAPRIRTVDTISVSRSSPAVVFSRESSRGPNIYPQFHLSKSTVVITWICSARMTHVSAVVGYRAQDTPYVCRQLRSDCRNRSRPG